MPALCYLTVQVAGITWAWRELQENTAVGIREALESSHLIFKDEFAGWEKAWQRASPASQPQGTAW